VEGHVLKFFANAKVDKFAMLCHVNSNKGTLGIKDEKKCMIAWQSIMPRCGLK
jgi:hypothetical protein